MILVCALAALTTVLGTGGPSPGMGRSARHGFGCCGGLAALVLDVSTRTMLLCLLIPCAAAMWLIGGRL